MYRGGLKKCVPKKWRRNSGERPSTILLMEMPEVFDDTMVPGFQNFSTFSRRLRLMSSFSTTTSMTQSTSPTQPRLSSKLPMVM